MRTKTTVFLLLLSFHSYSFAGICRDLAYGEAKTEMERLNNAESPTPDLIADVASQMRKMLSACYSEVNNDYYRENEKHALLFGLEKAHDRFGELINVVAELNKMVMKTFDVGSENPLAGILYGVAASASADRYGEAMKEKYSQSVDALNDIISKIKTAEMSK